MNTGIVKTTLALAALLILAGCATGTGQPSAHTGDEPIFSAAQAKEMIRVEVRELEPVPVESAVASSTN